MSEARRLLLEELQRQRVRELEEFQQRNIGGVGGIRPLPRTTEPGIESEREREMRLAVEERNRLREEGEKKKRKRARKGKKRLVKEYEPHQTNVPPKKIIRPRGPPRRPPTRRQPVFIPRASPKKLKGPERRPPTRQSIRKFYNLPSSGEEPSSTTSASERLKGQSSTILYEPERAKNPPLELEPRFKGGKRRPVEKRKYIEERAVEKRSAREELPFEERTFYNPYPGGYVNLPYIEPVRQIRIEERNRINQPVRNRQMARREEAGGKVLVGESTNADFLRDIAKRNGLAVSVRGKKLTVAELLRGISINGGDAARTVFSGPVFEDFKQHQDFVGQDRAARGRRMTPWRAFMTAYMNDGANKKLNQDKGYLLSNAAAAWRLQGKQGAYRGGIGY